MLISEKLRDRPDSEEVGCYDELITKITINWGLGLQVLPIYISSVWATVARFLQVERFDILKWKEDRVCLLFYYYYVKHTR